MLLTGTNTTDASSAAAKTAGDGDNKASEEDEKGGHCWGL